MREKTEKDGKGEREAPRESRRRFTKTAVGAALAAPAALASGGRAQTTPKSPETTAPPRPQATPPQSQPPQTPAPVAAAWAEVARALYGERLTPEEFERLRRGLEGNTRSSEALRAARLSNADEPDFTFEA